MIHRIAHLVALAVATLVDDTKTIQRLQANEGPLADGDRIIDNIPVMHHFGFTSSPPIGSDLLLVRQAGDRSQSIAVGSNHKKARLRNLAPGDTAMYDMRGAKVTMTAAGVSIDAAGLPITVRNFSTCTVEGDLHVTGDVISRASGDAVSLNGLHDAYNGHAHGGAQPGSGTTGVTNRTA